MDLKTEKISLWARGETIRGEDFIAANEGVVDVLAKLKRPTSGLKTIKYECLVKSRLIRPDVRPYNGPTLFVYIRTVYEIRDCAELQ